jgi:hypothetical protein
LRLWCQRKKRTYCFCEAFRFRSPAFSFDAKVTKEESWTLPCFAGKYRKKKMPFRAFAACERRQGLRALDGA